MLGMSSKANRDLDNLGYRIGLTTAAQEVILAAALGVRLDLRISDGYNIANLISYHVYVISLTS
jgi:hypothetical protein